MLSRLDFALFAEGPARLVVTVDPKNRDAWESCMKGFSCVELGKVTSEARLRFLNVNQREVFSVEVSELLSAWEAMLPFDWEDLPGALCQLKE